MITSTYTAALEEAQRELKDVTERLSDLVSRRAALENLVKTLKALSGADSASPTKRELGTTTSPQDQDQEKFLWKRIARVMKNVPGFSIAAAARHVESIDGISLGPNRSVAVRNALIRHPEMFRRNPNDRMFTVIGDVD
jgi:hypothetical protein